MPQKVELDGNTAPWNERIQVVLDAMVSGIADIEDVDLKKSEWFLNADIGETHVNASVSRPPYEMQAPMSVIVVQSAWQGHWNLPQNQIKRQMAVSFEHGSTTLSAEGETALVDIVSWLADNLRNGIPEEMPKPAR